MVEAGGRWMAIVPFRSCARLVFCFRHVPPWSRFGTDLLGSCLVLSPITLRSIVTPI